MVKIVVRATILSLILGGLLTYTPDLPGIKQINAQLGSKSQIFKAVFQKASGIVSSLGTSLK